MSDSSFRMANAAELIVSFSFLLGLAVGSFLNVVILRRARDEKITGRSRCESCLKTLSWHELIPILSFILQKGRCRSCGSALSWQYPLVELTTGVLFALVALVSLSFQEVHLGTSAFSGLYSSVYYTLLGWIILSASIVIFVSDIRWRIIPNVAVLVLLLSGLSIRFLLFQTETRFGTNNIIRGVSEESLLWDFTAAAVIALFFSAIWLITKGRGMGLGDAKLVFATSVILGFPESIVAMLLAFWIGAAAGILLIIFRLKSWKNEIAFGPYILIGAALAYFLGDYLIGFWS